MLTEYHDLVDKQRRSKSQKAKRRKKKRTNLGIVKKERVPRCVSSEVEGGVDVEGKERNNAVKEREQKSRVTALGPSDGAVGC